MSKPGPKGEVKVDFLNFRCLKNAVDEMQGHTFYCEDNEGILRRWTPPCPYKERRYE